MDIYQFAIQMEKDGESYYRKLSSECRNIGLAKIFSMLAEEEVKHCKIIEQVREDPNLPQIADTQVLEKVKNIFIEMKEQGFTGEPHIDTTEETNAYRMARDLEERSRDFYLEKANEAIDQDVKLLLEKLSKEEQKHLRIMENIVEFVSKPEPGNWLENAEWHHLDPY